MRCLPDPTTSVSGDARLGSKCAQNGTPAVGDHCFHGHLHKARSTPAQHLPSDESMHWPSQVLPRGGEEKVTGRATRGARRWAPRTHSCGQFLFLPDLAEVGRARDGPRAPSPRGCRGAAPPPHRPLSLPAARPAVARGPAPTAVRPGALWALRAPPRRPRAPPPGGQAAGALPRAARWLAHSPGRRRRRRFSSAASARSAAAPAAPAASAAAAPAAAARGLRRRGSSCGPAPRPHTATASSRVPRPCRIPAGLRRADPLCPPAFPCRRPSPAPTHRRARRRGARRHSRTLAWLRRARAPHAAAPPGGQEQPRAAQEAPPAPPPLPPRAAALLGGDKVQVMRRVEEARAGRGRKSC